MTDQTQMALPVARRLAGLGAFHGAAQVLFHAAIQRQAAEVRDADEWTPWGKIPARQPRPHLHASNDHLPDPSLSA